MSIFKTLKKLDLTSEESRSLFSDKTRDIDPLTVWRDRVSGVIYIDNFYTGEETYADGAYLDDKDLELKAGKPDFERKTDAERRFKSNLKFQRFSPPNSYPEVADNNHW